MKYLMMLAAAVIYFMPAAAQAQGTASQMTAVHQMEQGTLDRLYKERPETKREISDAAGYAVFSSGELAVIWVSAGLGHGIAHSNENERDTYMNMAKLGAGLGAGIKDYSTVFVFSDEKAFHNFITTGLDLSGTADVAAKAGVKGLSASGGADVLPGVHIYQLTETGLLAQAMIQGTKYWRDDNLNNAKVSDAK